MLPESDPAVCFERRHAAQEPLYSKWGTLHLNVSVTSGQPAWTALRNAREDRLGESRLPSRCRRRRAGPSSWHVRGIMTRRQATSWRLAKWRRSWRGLNVASVRVCDWYEIRGRLAMCEWLKLRALCWSFNSRFRIETGRITNAATSSASSIGMNPKAVELQARTQRFALAVIKFCEGVPRTLTSENILDQLLDSAGATRQQLPGNLPRQESRRLHLQDRRRRGGSR